jgi:hypothetical protein
MLDLNYFLVNNIDLSSIDNWTPLGTFTGELDGKNYAVSNMNLIVTDNNTQGLFKVLNNATIKNIILKDFKLTSRLTYNLSAVNETRKNFGLLSGQSTGTTIIDNLIIAETTEGSSFIRGEFIGSVADNRPSNFGGIIGLVNNNLIISNTFVDTTLSDLDSTGGFIGDIRSLTSLTITDSSFNGKILAGQSNAPTVVNIGGIIGSIFSGGTINIERVSVNTNLTLGNLSSEKNVITVGGIIGVLREQSSGTSDPAPTLNITRTKFIGNISGVGNLGKFIGSIYNSDNKNNGGISISDSYGIGSIVGNGYAVGHIAGSNRLGSRTFELNRVYVIGDVTSVNPTNKTRLGKLFGTNGDNNAGGSGTHSTTNVFYSNESTYSQDFIRGEMCGDFPGPGNNVACTGIRPGLVSQTGVTGQTNSNLKLTNTFNGWTNFNAIWRINPNINSGYPYLAWEE